MTTPLKWLYFFVATLVIIMFVVYFSAVQNTAITSTSDVEVLAENVSAGLIRANIEETNDGYAYFDKDELLASLVANVAEAQKNHKYEINLHYVFLDKDGQVTEVEDEMRGIQFQVQYVDRDGKVTGTAERRLTFNALEG